MTAVCLTKKSTSIPRRGTCDKLANEGKIKSIEVTGAMSSKDIECVLKRTFSCFEEDQTITFFKANGASGLAETSMPEMWTGRDLLKLVGQGCLYFLPTTIKHGREEEGTGVPLPLNPITDQTKSSGQWNAALLKDLLFYPMIGDLWLEEAGLSEHAVNDPEEV